MLSSIELQVHVTYVYESIIGTEREREIVRQCINMINVFVTTEHCELKTHNALLLKE